MIDETRRILHVDMDAFFAAVEQRDDPSLRGKPVLVGGAKDGRGVVSTASYEARIFGCRSAMSMGEAMRRCPHAVVVRPDFRKYKIASQLAGAVMRTYTDMVEPVSIDEAFLDVTASQRLFGDGVAIARKIRAGIFAATQLTASVGVAPNKFLAKLASDMNKPDGLTVITADTVDAIMIPLPIGRLWGVGAKTAARLNGLGFKTIGDLRRMDEAWFDQHLGSWGGRLRQLIHGIDGRPVESHGDAKSIGQEQTFGKNVVDAEVLRGVLLHQAETVARKLRRSQLFAGCVSVKIRFGDFQTITRARTLDVRTDLTLPIYEAAKALFDAWAADSFQPVRLIGVQAKELSREAQLGLFQQRRSEQQKGVETALDAITAKFGAAAIGRASLAGRRKRLSD